MLKVINFLLALVMLTASVPAVSASTHAIHAQPLLLQLAAEQPDKFVRIIVQKQMRTDRLEEAVTQLGGVVTRDLHIINAFVAELPAKGIPTLARNPEVRWVSLDAQVAEAGNNAEVGNNRLEETIALSEDFSTDFYNGAFSSGTWPARWVEIGEADGLSVGDVRLARFQGGESQGILLQNVASGIQSEVSLAGASQASMTITYKGKGFEANDAILIAVSNDGGGQWTEMARIAGASDAEITTATYDISTLTAPKTVIRFGTSFAPDSQARFYIDSIQIESTFYNDDNANAMEHLYLPLVSAAEGDDLATARLTAAAAEVDQAELTSAEKSVRDEFANNAFDNNDGSVNWSSSWVEVDESGEGPNDGKVRVKNGEMRLDRFWYKGADPSLTRSIAFPDAVTSATLSLDFRTTSGVDATDTVVLEVSSDSGLSYTTIATIAGITGETSDTLSVDVTEYASAEPHIRIRISENYGGLWEYIYIDNVQVVYAIDECPKCIETGNLTSPYIQAIGADRLWNETKPIQGDGIGVAVIDTGIANHDDLFDGLGQSRIISKVHFSSVPGPLDDFYGHGSHVAGTIGGNGMTSGGAYIGVAPRALLFDVKVINDQGIGTTADVIAGLQWVLENKDAHNIRVVNLSLSSTVAESYLTSPLNAAIEILWFNQVVVVVSAGNTGNGAMYPPANDPFAITVGAVDDRGTIDISDDVVAPYSAYGLTDAGFAKPDIVAPGTNLISLLSSDDSSLAFAHPSHRLSGIEGNSYFRMSGTSMAAAVTTGAVVLLLQDEPNLTPDQVKYRLMATARPFAGSEPGASGSGYLDAYAAVHGTTTESANTNIPASRLLWTGAEPIKWDSVNWDSVNWDSVNWDSVNWDSVNWDSVNWDSVIWDD